VTELVAGVAIMALVLALGIGIVAVGLRLNRRGIRRGTHPHRDLPWYLGGVPDLKLDAPVESSRARRRRR
jgi:hypothetical protein